MTLGVFWILVSYAIEFDTFDLRQQFIVVSAVFCDAHVVPGWYRKENKFTIYCRPNVYHQKNSTKNSKNIKNPIFIGVVL